MANVPRDLWDEVLERVVTGTPFRADPSRAPSGYQLHDLRGEVHTHGFGQRTAYNAGKGRTAVIGGVIVGVYDRNESWRPIKVSGTGDDCLKVGPTSFISGVAFDNSHDNIAPPKGLDGNKANGFLTVEHVYSRYTRDEVLENDASIPNEILDCLADNTYQFTSMRNPNNDAKFPNTGRTKMRRNIVRFALQPHNMTDAKRNRHDGPSNQWGAGGLIFKAGSKTGPKDVEDCFFFWETVPGRGVGILDQNFRQWKGKNNYFLYAPRREKIKRFPHALPPGSIDLGIYDDSIDLFFAVRDRWLDMHDCRPEDNYFGFTLRAGQDHPPFPNLNRIPEVTPGIELRHPKGASTPGPVPTPNPNPVPTPSPDPTPSAYPVVLSKKGVQSATVLMDVEVPVGAISCQMEVFGFDFDHPAEVRLMVDGDEEDGEFILYGGTLEELRGNNNAEGSVTVEVSDLSIFRIGEPTPFTWEWIESQGSTVRGVNFTFVTGDPPPPDVDKEALLLRLQAVENLLNTIDEQTDGIDTQLEVLTTELNAIRADVEAL